MKLVRDTTGRFPQRPHYEPRELDQECEKIICDFLRKKHGAVSFPVSTDDLTALIESEAEDLDLYADLSEYGEGVEGVTIFVPGGKPRVKIERTLSEATSRENRLRTTLTHEYGHVHFHNYLFQPVLPSLELFASSKSDKLHSDARGNTQLCKRETMVETSSADWMEWQAGHVCGAILMPVTHLRGVLQKHFGDRLSAGPSAPATALGAELINVVRRQYQVSADAARVRLLRLGLLANPGATAKLFPN